MTNAPFRPPILIRRGDPSARRKLLFRPPRDNLLPSLRFPWGRERLPLALPLLFLSPETKKPKTSNLQRASVPTVGPIPALAQAKVSAMPFSRAESPTDPTLRDHASASISEAGGLRHSQEKFRRSNSGSKSPPPAARTRPGNARVVSQGTPLGELPGRATRKPKGEGSWSVPRIIGLDCIRKQRKGSEKRGDKCVCTILTLGLAWFSLWRSLPRSLQSLMARDDFKKAVIKNLQLRVSNSCSNPDCCAPTSAPHSSQGISISAGEASHICAASPGGPRYDPLMSSQQRASIDNAIWLCKNCARKIDLDTSLFTVANLKQWKADAENRAVVNLGVPRPPNVTIETVTQALTGLPLKHITSALPNVARATKEAIEAKNPNIVVEIEYFDGRPNLKVNPKPGCNPIEVTIIPSEKSAKKFWQKVHEGLPFKWEEPIKVLTNPPIADTDASMISIGAPDDRDAEFSIFDFHNPCKAVRVPAQFAIGRSKMVFKGTIGKKLLNIEIEGPRESDSSAYEMLVNFSHPDLSEWNGAPLHYLPNLPKLTNISEILKSKPILDILVEGHNAISVEVGNIDFGDLHHLINSLEMVSVLAKKLNIEARFNEVEFFDLDFQEIYALSILVNDGRCSEVIEAERIIQVPVARESSWSPFDIPRGPSALKVERMPRALNFFDKEIFVPVMTMVMHEVTFDPIENQKIEALLLMRQAAGAKVEYMIDLEDIEIK